MHNQELKRQHLEGRYLYLYLSELTGKNDGREIVAQVEEWKRISGALTDLCHAFKYWGIEQKRQTPDNQDPRNDIVCSCCGRSYNPKKMTMRKFKYSKAKVCEPCSERYRVRPKRKK